MRIPWIVAFALLPLASAAEIHIVSATYGPNCGAAHDNAKTPVAAACEGKRRCEYIVDFHVLGDPAVGCAKTFVAEWACSVTAAPEKTTLPAEAGNGSVLRLSCGLPPGADVPPKPDVGATNGAGPIGGTISPPTLEIAALNPSQPIYRSSWSAHFRLINNWLAGQPLNGWIDAVAYDAADVARARAIAGQSYPIADVQPDQVAEGDLVFSTTVPVVNGQLELTYFHIYSGYTPGAHSADGVLQDVPSDVKAKLLQDGHARALSTATSEFVVVHSPEADKLAVVFDFDPGSCYPSAAVDEQGIPNPGLEEQTSGLTTGCRERDQLQTSKTYYRTASIRHNGVSYGVHMYALYFMKDKVHETQFEAYGYGHRHDWEFVLVWTTNGAITHASYSAHGTVTTKPISSLAVDAADHVKVVYQRQIGLTHSMRFAGQDEVPENHLGRWVTPTLFDWHTMTNSKSNADLQHIFNTHNFDEANCSFNDSNFPVEITKEIPAGYPSDKDWIAAAKSP